MPIHMTCHDEIVTEVDEARVEEAKALLRHEMLMVPEWAAGLPLQSEENICPWYTKSKTALSGSRRDGVSPRAGEAGVSSTPSAHQPKILRWPEPVRAGRQLPCHLMGELLRETERFWVFRRPSGQIERCAKSYLTDVDQGRGVTSMGRFRGEARQASPVHFEPCPDCPDYAATEAAQ
jgi:hypothetical protein